MSISSDSNDWAPRSIPGDDKSRFSGGCQSDDGRCVLLKGRINSSDGNGLDGYCGGRGEAAELSKHNAVEHGCLSLETNVAHDSNSLCWVLACIWKDKQLNMTENLMAVVTTLRFAAIPVTLPPPSLY